LKLIGTVFFFRWIPRSAKFLDTQGILSIVDSIVGTCATAEIKCGNQPQNAMLYRYAQRMALFVRSAIYTMATLMMSSKGKDFFVDYGDGNKASVDVTCEHTLAGIRWLMYKDWDDDMLPGQDVEWAFWGVDSNQRITKKQEGHKKAWDFIGKDVRILEGIDKKCNKQEVQQEQKAFSRRCFFE
jgi:hypothetical protein